MKIFASLAVFTLAVSSISLFAASPTIGIATTLGTVSVNQAPTSGSTELTDGSRLETATAPSDVRMANGADVRLATRSAGTFYSDHVLLEDGALRVNNFNGLTVNASQLQINSDESGAQAIIRYTRKGIQIASLGGSVKVMDSGMLTRVAAGTKMSFQQSGADQSTTTGAAPAPKPSHMPSDQKTFLWVIGCTAVAALVIGLIAASEGKSPF